MPNIHNQDPPQLPMTIGDIYLINLSDRLPRGIYIYIYLDPVRKVVFLKRQKQTKDGNSPTATAPRHRAINSIACKDLENLLNQKFAVKIERQQNLVVPQLPKKRKEKEREKAIAKLDKTRDFLTALCNPDLLHEVIVERSYKPIFQLAAAKEFANQHAKRLFFRLLDAAYDIDTAVIDRRKTAERKTPRKVEKKLGRQYKHVRNGSNPERNGRNFNEDDHKNLTAYINSGGYKHDNSLQWNYENFKAIFNVKQVHKLANGKVVPETLPEDQFITRSQFVYNSEKIHKALAYTFSTKKLIEITRRGFRVYTGSSRSHIPCPGHSILIDSTLADVYLVCSWDRTRIIGRPLLYFVVDALTSVVLGIHISLRAPSGVEAKMALFSALSNKTELLTKYSLNAYSHFFPRAPIPYEFLPDRAELLSSIGREAASALNCAMGMPSAYTPQWKAAVERIFKTINNFSIHWIPGSTRGRVRERGQPDVRLDAILTMEEFTRIILLSVLQWNALGRSTQKLLPSMLKDETATEPGPSGYFNWGLENLHGSPAYFTNDELVTKLLPGSICEIGSEGIHIDNNRWGAPWMNDPQLRVAGLLSSPVHLYRNPVHSKQSYIHLKGESQLRESTLLEMPCAGSIFDLEEYFVVEQTKHSIHKMQNEGLQTSITHEMNSLIASARSKTAIANKELPISKSEKTKSIRQNRNNEINGQKFTAKPADDSKTHEEDVLANWSASSFASNDFMAALRKISNKNKS